MRQLIVHLPHVSLSFPRVVSVVVLFVTLALSGLAPLPAGAQTCGVPITIPIANSGFEDPPVAASTGVLVTSLPGWTVAGAEGTVVLSGPDNTFAGSQYVTLGDGIGGSGSVSQALDGTALAGSTVTFTINSLRSGTITLGDQSQAVTGTGFAVSTHTVIFNVPAGTTGDLTLTLSGSEGWSVNQISGSYVVPCTAPVVPTDAEQCKNGGWRTYTDVVFKNQGDCVSYVETNGANPPSGGQ